MDRIVEIAVSLIAVQTIITSVIVWIVQRVLGKKLDVMDEKRDLARRSAEEAAEDGRAWRQAMEGGMKSLLRAELVHQHTRWVALGYCPLEQKTYVEKLHADYKAVGGNSIGDGLYEELMALPTKTNTEI